MDIIWLLRKQLLLDTKGKFVWIQSDPENGWAALHFTSRSGDVVSSRTLLEAGGSVDLRTKVGKDVVSCHMCFVLVRFSTIQLVANVNRWKEIALSKKMLHKETKHEN